MKKSCYFAHRFCLWSILYSNNTKFRRKILCALPISLSIPHKSHGEKIENSTKLSWNCDFFRLSAGGMVEIPFPRQILFKIILQVAAAAGMTKLAQCFCLDLADPFPGDVEGLSNLLQCVCLSVVQSKTKPEYHFLAWR